MYALAWEEAGRQGADFIATGEVLGQRPMSQNREAFARMEKGAGLRGLVLRPLSGRLLPPTIPEERGLIDRADLLDLQGRGRKRQIAMAEELGIGRYEMPAGGCLLTDAGFEIRLRDLLRFGEPTAQEIQLLKLGRHFRIDPGHKAVLGRDAADCAALEALLGPDDLRFDARDMPGPHATLRGEASPEAVRQVAQLVLRYAKADPQREHVVAVRRGAADAAATVEQVSVRPMDEEQSWFMLVAAEGRCGGYGGEAT